MSHFIYILACGDGSYYTGYTTDVEERVRAHKEGKGAKYTRGRGPLELVYTEEFSEKSLAMKREWEIKHRLTRKDKEDLIRKCLNNP